MTTRRRNILTARHGQTDRPELIARYDRLAARAAKETRKADRDRLIEEVRFLGDLLDRAA